MDILDIIILVAIAISGTVFGSFFTLAVHRIPRKEDITHERSYCPKCNHKLNFLDLIPVFSYIFLGGKCRYCKEKIRPRYLLLEIFSGIVFLLLGLSYGIGYQTSAIHFISFAILILFLCCVFITAGIDKEKYIIPNGVMIYGLIIAVSKVLLEKFFVGNDIYPNMVGALAIPLILLLVNSFSRKCDSSKEVPFGEGDIKFLSIIGLFTGFGLQILIIAVSLILVLIFKVFEMIFNKENKQIAWGFYLAIATSMLLIVAPHISATIEALNFMIVS